MSEAVYILCALTSLACSFLLFRGYRRTGVRLLFWSALCFAGLALDNILLYVDLVIVPATDLTLYRRIPGLLALSLLIFGLIWDGS
ncbi:MAG: hypothetical protein HY000_32570 [Planctomycetes bacterium]|nr:hypothetical protein [Planctomycetota bacterium]